MTPPTVTIEGEIWGRRVPLWLDRDGTLTLQSLAGQVSTDAPLWLVYERGTLAERVALVKGELRRLGYLWVHVEERR